MTTADTIIWWVLVIWLTPVAAMVGLVVVGLVVGQTYMAWHTLYKMVHTMIWGERP